MYYIFDCSWYCFNLSLDTNKRIQFVLVYNFISYILYCECNNVFHLYFYVFWTYSGYDRPTFPIKDVVTQNMYVLNNVNPSQKDSAIKLLEEKMAERFINDAIKNRELNVVKNKKHYWLIRMIMATFVVTFITFAINVSISYFESKTETENIQEIHIQGGEINVR